MSWTRTLGIAAACALTVPGVRAVLGWRAAPPAPPPRVVAAQAWFLRGEAPEASAAPPRDGSWSVVTSTPPGALRREVRAPERYVVTAGWPPELAARRAALDACGRKPEQTITATLRTRDAVTWTVEALESVRGRNCVARVLERLPVPEAARGGVGWWFVHLDFADADAEPQIVESALPTPDPAFPLGRVEGTCPGLEGPVTVPWELPSPLYERVGCSLADDVTVEITALDQPSFSVWSANHMDCIALSVQAMAPEVRLATQAALGRADCTPTFALFHLGDPTGLEP